MKAFGINKYGLKNFSVLDVPEPKVGPSEVLVEIKAASINPLDFMILNGEFKQLLKYKFPVILGHDVSGVVTQIGADVKGFKIGDEVFGGPRDYRIGTFAERISIDQSDLAQKPSSLSFVEAASIPLVGLAAYQALLEAANVKPGQKVLVHGGAGALGSISIQIAKHLGSYVATTVRTQDIDLAKNLGADEVIDFTKQNFEAILTGFDIVLDSLGPKSVLKSLKVLKPGGIVVSFTGPPDANFAIQLGQPLLKPVMALMSYKVRRQAKKLGVKYAFFFMKANGEQLQTLSNLFETKVLKTLVAKTFEFAQTKEAFEYVAQGKAKGKVVITRA